MSDVLVHELVHVKLILAGQSSAHNDVPWSKEIERLSPLVLGRSVNAEPVKTRRIDGRVKRQARDGFLTRRALAMWPYALRPPHGPRGEMIPVPNY